MSLLILKNKKEFLCCHFWIILLCSATVTTLSNGIFMKKISTNFFTALKYNIFNWGGKLFRCLSVYNVSESALYLQAVPILCSLVVNRCQLNYMREMDCVFQKLFNYDEIITAKPTNKLSSENVLLTFLPCCFARQRPRRTIIFLGGNQWYLYSQLSSNLVRRQLHV